MKLFTKHDNSGISKDRIIKPYQILSPEQLHYQDLIIAEHDVGNWYEPLIFLSDLINSWFSCYYYLGNAFCVNERSFISYGLLPYGHAVLWSTSNRLYFFKDLKEIIKDKEIRAKIVAQMEQLKTKYL